jgi:hypothetical protein
MFPQCAPANLETSCLLEIGDVSRKLRLLWGCRFLGVPSPLQPSYHVRNRVLAE